MQLCEVMHMLTNLIVVIILQYTQVANHHKCSLNLHNVICQLHLNKAGEKKEWISFWKKDTVER